MSDKMASFISACRAEDDCEGDGIVISKQYEDGKIERVTLDDLDDLKMLLEELSELLPKKRCPECGGCMTAQLTKEYACEDCMIVGTEHALELREMMDK